MHEICEASIPPLSPETPLDNLTAVLVAGLTSSPTPVVLQVDLTGLRLLSGAALCLLSSAPARSLLRQRSGGLRRRRCRPHPTSLARSRLLACRSRNLTMLGCKPPRHPHRASLSTRGVAPSHRFGGGADLPPLGVLGALLSTSIGAFLPHAWRAPYAPLGGDVAQDTWSTRPQSSPPPRGGETAAENAKNCVPISCRCSWVHRFVVGHDARMRPLRARMGIVTHSSQPSL